MPENEAGSDNVHFIRQAKDQADIVRKTLQRVGGGGNGGGVTDDWKDSVDRQLGQLHNDVRAMLNRGVLAVVALAGLIGGQYVYFNEKFESVKDRLAAVEAKIEGIDQKLDILIDTKKDDSPQRK